MKKTDFIAMVENIYVSLNYNKSNFMDFLKSHKTTFINLRGSSQEDFEFYIRDEIEVLPKGIQRYPFGFEVKEKMRIYFSVSTGDNFPIYVIVSAQHLHLNSVDAVIIDILKYVSYIINHLDSNYEFDIDLIDFKLSRIDICNHNTVINIDKYIRFDEFNSRVVTKIKKVFPVVELVGENDIKVPYYRYGSGSIAVRFYNKTLEVVEMRYKSFFFQLWYDKGLIDEKTKEVYEEVYKLNNNYYVDFMFINIIKSGSLNDREIYDLVNYYNDVKIENSDKYDFLKNIIKDNNIELVKEVINVEFQLRSDFLKTLKLVNHETGNIIDYSNIYELFDNLEVLYRHLTNDSFRVVSRKSNYKRKRYKEVDYIWKLVAAAPIQNISRGYETDNEVYRIYQKNMSETDTIKKALKNLAHLYYLNSDEIDETLIQGVNLQEMFNGLSEGYKMNENYFNIERLLQKQIKYYGKKNKTRNCDSCPIDKDHK